MSESMRARMKREGKVRCMQIAEKGYQRVYAVPDFVTVFPWDSEYAAELERAPRPNDLPASARARRPVLRPLTREQQKQLRINALDSEYTDRELVAFPEKADEYRQRLAAIENA